MLDGLDGLQGALHLHHLTRRHTACGYLGNDALQIAYLLQPVVDGLAEVRVAEEVIDDVQALVDGLLFFEGEDYPAPQQTAAHRRYGAVYDVQE